MTKTEMLDILRGKVLQESPDEIQARLNKIADELEQSERVVHGHWTEKYSFRGAKTMWVLSMCARCEKECEWESPYCPNCGVKMDEVSE